MLLPLLCATGVPVAKQPLVQQHGVDGADVGLRQQLPTHVQQAFRGIPLLRVMLWESHAGANDDIKLFMRRLSFEVDCAGTRTSSELHGTLASPHSHACMASS